MVALIRVDPPTIFKHFPFQLANLLSIFCNRGLQNEIDFGLSQMGAPKYEKGKLPTEQPKIDAQLAILSSSTPLA